MSVDLTRHDHAQPVIGRCPLETRYGTWQPPLYCNRRKRPGYAWCGDHVDEYGDRAPRNVPGKPWSNRSSFNDPVLREFRLMCDDEWGTGMDFMFAVCMIMYTRCPDLIPAEWEYSPGLGFGGTEADLQADAEDNMTLSMMLEADPADDVLLRSGRVLHLYLDAVRAAGKDY